MTRKPTYEELELRVKELEKKAVERMRAEVALTPKAEQIAPSNIELENSYLVDGKYSIKDLIDIERLRKTLEKFSLATGFTTGFLEYPSQEILVATGWRDICTKFHRAFPESEKHCKESNIYLTEQLKQQKELSIKPCENGLVDGATPIVIKGKYIAYLATGQVLFEEPDIERFKRQAEIYGYDVETYLEALSKVPVVSEEQFKNAMSFLSELAVTIGETGLNNLELKEKTRELEEEITDGKKTAIALRESEIKYSTLVENSKDGIMMISDGLLSFVNKASIKLIGYSPEEMIGANFLNFVAPDYRKLVLKRHAERMEGKDVPSTYKIELLRKDSKTIQVELDAKRINFEGKPANLVFIRDTAERKQAEEALRESEEKHRTALEASPDPVVLYDMEGKAVYINPAFTRIFGWTLKDLKGKKIDYVPKENWPETRKMLDRLNRGESFHGFETRRYNKKREILDISMSFDVWRDKDGNPAGSVVILHDVTKHKKLESQLQQAQKMESLGTLAGGIAHDFNNLLMGIQGRISMVLMDIDSSHPHSQHLKEIEDYVKSATNLTKQLLGFARGGKYEVKPTDLNELIKRENKMFGRARKEINVQEKFEKNLWTTDVDQGQIEQVLLNIYVNAWHAMSGGGDLYIQTENITIDESYSKPYYVKPGKFVKVSVTDTGSGMDQATQEKIFDPFFTTKEIGRGTGLGLASAYGIIKNHGGFINVYSEKGKGATFNIYLPISGKEIIKERKHHEELLRGSESVLLVDDEDIIIDVEKGIIEKLGYKVLIAKSGKEAIEIYRKNLDKIDMVMLDMVMPDMGGGDTYDRLKEINPNIKVLLSSGYSINGQAAKILERGCNGFIQKPFNIVEFSKKIRGILNKK